MPARPVRNLLLTLIAVLALAGCNGEETPEAGAPEEDAQTVAVVGQDNLTWDAEELTVDAGEVTVILTCEPGVNHNFVIEDTGEEVVACDRGETETGTVELEAGEYTYVCTVPGHEQTMRGTLIVD